MADRRKELEQELQDLQKEIETSLAEIKSDIDSWTDAKYWIHRYPFQAVGASACLGLLISLLTGKKTAPSVSYAKEKKFSGLFFNEIRKQASRSAAKLVVKFIEESLEKKRREGEQKPS